MEIIKAQTTDLVTTETMEIRFLGQLKSFPVQDIQNLPDIVKREILHPALNDKELGTYERKKVTKRLISMLQIKFDSKPQDAHPDDLSPQELAMAEFGSFIRQYPLTSEEVIEAYRMGARKQLLDIKGNVIQIYPNLSIIQAGEVLNSYQEYKTENQQHTKGIQKLKLLANPETTISPEEAKANNKRLLQKLADSIVENKPCGHAFLFFELVIKKGGLKSFLISTEAQNLVIRKKMKEIIDLEKRKKKSVFFNPYELNQLSGFFKSNSNEILKEIKFSFERLQAMAITQVKNDLVYNWMTKQIIKKNKMKISELKIDQEVIINAVTFLYKGIQKRRFKGVGTVLRIIFQEKDSTEEKDFDLRVFNKELKTNKDGQIEFK